MLSKLLHRIPWFVAAPGVVLASAGFLYIGYAHVGEYFNETCKNERNLLTGEFEPSNCGEGAAVAKLLRERGGAPTDAPADASGATLATGSFRGGDSGHHGSGIAEIQRLADGSLNVFIKDFAVTNGPDLFVVLSRSASGDYAADDLTLASLKANNGSQNYAVPAGTDLADFKSVLIWCRSFDVKFAYATLDFAPEPSAGAPGPTVRPTDEPASAPASPTPATAGAGVLAIGSFRDGAPGHHGNGRVEIQRLADGSLNLFISGLSVTNGPDLWVALSISDDGDYTDNDVLLEKLKANNGSQNYAIPAGTDTAAFRTVIIWCRSFDTLFAFAPLEVQS